MIPAVLDDFATEGGQAYIPMEQLSVLDDADVLIWGTEGPEDRANLEAEPLYNALEPVQDGKLVFTDGVTAGAIYFTSPLSLPFVLEQLVPALASTLAGEGPADDRRHVRPDRLNASNPRLRRDFGAPVRPNPRRKRVVEGPVRSASGWRAGRTRRRVR